MERDRPLPKQLVITVTAEDVEKGVRCDCVRCPVARAVRRAARRHIPAATVNTGAHDSYVSLNFGGVRYLHSEALVLAIGNFDLGVGVDFPVGKYVLTRV